MTVHQSCQLSERCWGETFRQARPNQGLARPDFFSRGQRGKVQDNCIQNSNNRSGKNWLIHRGGQRWNYTFQQNFIFRLDMESRSASPVWTLNLDASSWVLLYIVQRFFALRPENFHEAEVPFSKGQTFVRGQIRGRTSSRGQKDTNLASEKASWQSCRGMPQLIVISIFLIVIAM